MNKKNIILSLFIGTLLTFVMPLCAQNQTVTGLVVDVSGEPIIGATVMVVNGTVGTVTDIDGKFNIKVAPKSKLKVSFVGYTSQIISDLKNPRIVLLEDQLKLDEVVVLGDYGSQKLRNATGAIETISTEELKDLSVGSLGDALAGKINGLHVSLSGGRPGSTPSLQIRQSSVNTTITPSSDLGGNASPTPLYVIDGFIADEGAFNNLDINEVENVTVLKDAAAAVYGARAAYGVVLVKTKQGKVGAPKISYSGQFGYTDALMLPKMLNAYDYGRIYNAARAANTATKDQESDDLRVQLFQSDELEAMKGMNYNLLDKEWSAALTQRHSVNISGGTEKATYFGGVSYYQQEGNIGRLDYNRWNYRAGVNANISKWMKASLQVSGNYGETNKPKNVKGGGSDGDFESLMLHVPYVPDQVNGYYIFHSGMENITNPSDQQKSNFAAVQNASDNVENQNQNFSLNGSLEYDFGWSKYLRGLKVKASYSKNISTGKTNTIGTKIDVYRLISRGGSGGHLYVGDEIEYNANTLGLYELNNGNSLGRSMNRSDSYQMNLTVSYARQFGKHYVSGLFSIEKAESEWEDLNGSLTDPLPFTDGQSSSVDSNAEGFAQTVTFNRSESGMLSYVGRVNYSYDDKYLFEFMLRSDASAKFAPQNYWGMFPSWSAGWVISDEKWFDKDKTKIDFLKIRGSFGILGKDNVNAWLWTQLYTRNPDKGPIFGTNSSTNTSATIRMPKQGVNPDVHWDKTYKTNFGIDMAFLKNRMSANLDFYYDMGREMFASHQGTSYYPNTVGIQPAPENFGEVDTYGVELSLGWKDKIGKDMSYWVKLTTGYNDNKIRETGWKAAYDFDKLVRNERSDRGLWGYECIGMFRSYQEINEYFDKYSITKYLGNTKENVHPGMLIYKDVRGQYDESTGTFGPADGIVDEQDYIKISHRASNPYGGTLNFGFSYKDFSISAQFGASWGAYSLVPTTMRKESYSEYSNVSAMWKDMFVYEDIYDANNIVTVAQNRNAKYPNIRYSSVNGAPSTFWKVSAATVQLRNMTVAYALPKEWLKIIGISSCRFNLTCQNVFNFLNPYPEGAWASWAGSYGYYPNLRKFTLGVNVSF
ncbi:TonB-dependent receptor [Bacteroides thetaiotaomicron]|jgi:tonB-linked outer membrane protein, susC/ragA family|uniref:SusC/RagA family TonB-linked outer membrane protein n=1 Tax=Bacteroides thetaiotaomicron TaxID=818 RepID=UPI0008A38509|nr:TonB-dependent receptor [Bacteroides thetaiotaomicron]MBD9170986.1 TonB-dependent receptor [Bacteroides thetaiotaomicron]MCE9222463.1 TonB-dependent receptor [Bacteroides thetaiotaomicron]MDC2171598.1 TonB-dependent receptor [Bacteroides thetaiotaomicron]MDC2182859.1 TonB-dependent receptor [Bacteroides thetaiotaomicron]MDC2187158.1 TonB-dependent receptor [Bacteroides thetaiotaomicron]